MNSEPRLKFELRALIRLAFPVALSQVALFAMQIVDTMFVGRLGAIPLGGVSVANAYFGTVMVTGVGLLLGLDFWIAKSFGAGQTEEAHSYTAQGLWLATFIAIPSTLLLYFARSTFTFFGIDENINQQASVYLSLLCWSLYPTLIYIVLKQYLQALNNPVPTLVILIVANLVNILANWVFVFGHLGFTARGIEGAALATLVSRVFMIVALLIYLLIHEWNRKPSLLRASFKYSREKISQLTRLGIPASGQLLLEVSAFSLSTLMAGKLGAIPLSAHQIVLQIASITFMIPLGISSATSVRIAQALGGGQPKRAARIGWLALALGGGFMACTGIGLYVFQLPILGLFTDDRAIIQTAGTLLLIAALFQVFDGIQVVGSGALRGVGNTRTSMLSNLFGHWIIGLPTSYFLCLVLHYGIRSLWIGLSLGLISVALLLSSFWWLRTRKMIAISA